ncbi:hypothetical protein [Bacillus chungangensis]|uniref:Membrane protein YiaA n=1 Tax=Bacillus chungangensis TaxID=587633 RepID=A0ABT9WU07_9BACI|nr:hypothetical protein [Bacillus chungangensis]MDQ0176781.1 putative membrane protein YiaA [Bacillus chungangensis]
MSSEYIFIIASIVAIFSILTIFKIQLEKLKANPENMQKIQLTFFIGIAIAELIPVILLFYGIMNITPVAALSELYVPAFVILAVMAFGSFFVYLQTKADVSEDAKNLVTSFAFVANAVAMSIPIISLVGLFMMLPK